ncbi:YceI family protein [Helicobacter himalayensis]|uniref:YceI family protein n=1 Tax=Helicobacter himalayensis TaxID=1591088 RepID=UPI00082F9A4F|nr:YceI family protein [Helicobacter himalayensis]
MNFFQKSFLVGVAFWLIFGVSSVFGAESYDIKQQDSKIAFYVKKLGFIGVSGEFKKFAGNLCLDKSTILALEGVVELESVFSNSKGRDKHLKEKDFLDTANFKQAHLKMLNYETKEQKDNKILGTMRVVLDLHGVQKELELTTELQNSQELELILRGELNIKDFEIKGSAMNSNSVKLEFHTIWKAK